MNESFESKKLTKEEAVMRIAELFQRTLQMGNTDREPDLFREISKKLDAGEITPDQAVEEATVIWNGKQEAF